MGLLDFFKSWWNRRTVKPLDDGTVERAFNVTPATSEVMKKGIELWWALYTNNPPWETDCVKPLGLPGAIGRELTKFALAEFNVSVSGGPRADYLNERVQAVLVPQLSKDLELGLCLGGFAMRPYIDQRGLLLVDGTGATAFSPVEFDGTGKAVSGVFREIVKVKKKTYCRLEYHGFEDGVYIIRNKAYEGETGGGTQIDLATVPQWANLAEEVRVENVDQPLFSYFKNPSSNDIDPSSEIGVSVYGGEPNAALLRQADEQWERLWWEFESGERKIFSDGKKVSAGQFHDRLFEYGDYTSEGNLFEPFSPEFRHDPLYSGFQWILQRIEYNVGLSFGTISDPQSVERTATEILAAKNRQRITVKAIQNAMENTINGVIYAMNAYCDLYGLAPAGEYEVTYNWGDGVLDDPETVRQDKAMMLQEISAGITNPWEYRVAFKKEDEDTAKAMLPNMEEMVTENQEEIE